MVLLIKAKFWVFKHLKTVGQLHEQAGRGQHVCMHRWVYHHGGDGAAQGVKMIYAAGGDPLSTSHQGKGLYG